jgi:hypothetical protein
MDFKCGAFLHPSIEPLFSKTANKFKVKAISLKDWTGPGGFQEVETPRFQENHHM